MALAASKASDGSLGRIHQQGEGLRPTGSSGAAAEAVLIQAAQGGDLAALGRLLLTYESRLSRRLSVRMPVSARPLLAVEDILQQTFVEAFRDVREFEYRGDGSFFAWLRAIMDHQMLNGIKGLRCEKRGGRRRILAENDVSASAYHLFYDVCAEGDSPSRGVSRKEAISALQVAISQLPADYREVIQRRFFLGQSIQQTAKAMQRSSASVRALTTRAKHHLRETLGRLSHYLSVR